MTCPKKIFIITLLMLLPASLLLALNSGKERKSNFVNAITGLGKNIIESYSGWNSLYHIAGVGLTYFLVKNDYDASMLKATSKMDENTSVAIGFPGIMLGYIAPMAVPATMYFAGRKNNRELQIASYAVMQSLGVAVVANGLLKAVTGRRPPDPDHENKEKLSRQFRFGFLRGGLHYGWPSGHLMANMAMASALTAYYPEKTWLKFLSYGYVSYVTASVLIDERGDVHWLSEVIAGGLMGYVIGTTVGRNFYKLRQNRNKTACKDGDGSTSIHWFPLISPEVSGVTVGISF